MSSELKSRIDAIRERMAAAALRAGRRPEEILLCAACKTRDSATVEESARLGIDLFGENHVQELVSHYDDGAYLGKPAHLIGHLQTNKIRKALGRASMIESVDSLRLLQALEAECAKQSLVQEVLVELNIGAEESKTGLPERELVPLLEQACTMEHIRVKGLMAIPPAAESEAESRRFFARVRELARRCGELGLPNVSMETLSMGMSGDFESAILEGATIVRTGTAVYGPRYYGPRAGTAENGI